MNSEEFFGNSKGFLDVYEFLWAFDGLCPLKRVLSFPEARTHGGLDYERGALHPMELLRITMDY